MIEVVASSKSHSTIKDIGSIVLFIVLVIIGVNFINAFIFRSFNVEGPSMEKTLFTGDKLIVNKIPVTIQSIQGKPYIPSRGQVIVFKNPNFSNSGQDEYIVKRVVAFPGERVTVLKGKVTVYNGEYPQGFNPDSYTSDSEGHPASGDVDVTVDKGEIFVIGDHRQDSYSLDSRNGLGTVPYHDIVGPVGLRIFPFQNFRTF